MWYIIVIILYIFLLGKYFLRMFGDVSWDWNFMGNLRDILKG
jgi:hypothetical protein